MFIIGYLTAKKDYIGIIKFGFPYAVVAGLSNGITNFLGLIIASMMDLSISSPTSMIIKNVLTFIIVLLIFKEKMSYRKIAGLIVSMAAVLLITLRF